jgi:hypothetical protein
MLIVPGSRRPDRLASHVVEQCRWLARMASPACASMSAAGATARDWRGLEQSCPTRHCRGRAAERTAAPGASPDLWLAGLCDGGLGGAGAADDQTRRT